MPALDGKAYLAAALKQQHGRLIKDLQALEPDAQLKPFAGCARSPLYMIAEVAWLNGWIAGVLQGNVEKRLTDEEEEALCGSVTSADQAIAMLDELVAKLQAAYDTVDENSLGDITDKPFGRPTPLFQCAFLPISHMMYHDGQLNYVQCLHGDGKIYW